MSVGEYIDGSQYSNQPRWCYRADGGGYVTIAFGVPGGKVQGRRDGDPAWVIFFMDDATSVEVMKKRWREVQTVNGVAEGCVVSGDGGTGRWGRAPSAGK